MSIRLNKTLGIACLSMLFQVGASSQNVATTSSSQDQNPNSSTTSSSIKSDTDPMKQLALASDAKSAGDAKNDKNAAATVAEPKISPRSPAVNPRIVARESHLNNQPFEQPDLSVLGDAKPFTATAYALKGRTRSGVYVRRGVIAADPRILPLGSVVHLKAGKYSGVYTVQDTGRLIKGNVVDVWMPTNQEARSFGRRKIKIHVLREGGKKVKSRK